MNLFVFFFVHLLLILMIMTMITQTYMYKMYACMFTYIIWENGRRVCPIHCPPVAFNCHEMNNDCSKLDQ